MFGFASVGFNYSDFFDDKDSQSIEKLLADIDREKALIFVANLNAQTHMFKLGDLKPQIVILKDWIHEFDDKAKSKIFKVVLPHIKSGLFNFINQPSCLKLIQEILLNSSNSGRNLSKTDKFNLFKAYLLCSSTYFESIIDEEIDLSKKDEFIKWSLESQLPISDLKTTKKFYIQLYKSIELFTFLENFSEHSKKLLDDYLGSNTFSNWQEYLRSLLRVYMDGLYKSEQLLNHAIINTTGHEEPSKLLDSMTIDISDYEPKEDFIELRDKPILRLDDKIYLVLSIDLFINKIFDGIVFDIYSSISKNEYKGISTASLVDFMSFLGDNFVEEVLLYNVLEYIKKPDWKTFKGKELIKNNPGSPDYLIIRRSKVFIIECKDLLINKSIKLSRNYKSIDEYMYSRLVEDKSSPKALMQILNFIKDIVHERVKNVSISHSSNTKYYPIIVVTDNALEEHGFNNWLIEKFKYIIEDHADIKPFVKLPVIIQLDQLIENSSDYESNKIKLNSILDSYLNYLNSSRDMFRRTDSFRNFLSRTIGEKFRGEAIPEESIMKSSIEKLGD